MLKKALIRIFEVGTLVSAWSYLLHLLPVHMARGEQSLASDSGFIGAILEVVFGVVMGMFAGAQFCIGLLVNDYAGFQWLGLLSFAAAFYATALLFAGRKWMGIFVALNVGVMSHLVISNGEVQAPHGFFEWASFAGLWVDAAFGPVIVVAVAMAVMLRDSFQSIARWIVGSDPGESRGS